MGSPDDGAYPPVAERIKSARIRTGLSAGDAAAELGLTIASYDDLEMHDDEVFMTVTLSEVGILARLLETTPCEIVVPEGARIPEPVAMSVLLAAVNREIEASGETIDAFENRIEFDVASALQRPECGAVHVDWLAVLASWGSPLE